MFVFALVLVSEAGWDPGACVGQLSSFPATPLTRSIGDVPCAEPVRGPTTRRSSVRLKVSARSVGVWKLAPRALEMLAQEGRERCSPPPPPAVPFLAALPRSAANRRPRVLLNACVPGSEILLRTDESTWCGISTVLVRIKSTCRYEPRNMNVTFQ